MFSLRIFVSVVLLTPLLCQFTCKSKHMDLFERSYSMNSPSLNLTLTIECRNYQLLSIRMAPPSGSPEMPRFRVFFEHETMGMNRDQYTFLEYCNVDVEVAEQNCKLEVRRKGTKQLIFAIDDVDIQEKYVKVTTRDQAQIWGLGERFQERFHVANGMWTLWNRDRPWVIDSGNPAKSQQTYGHNPLYLAREQESKKFHITYYKNVHAMNVEKRDSQLTYHAVGGDPHFLLFVGESDPQRVLKRFHNYIGPGHIPPFWAMGWHQCRWGYKNISYLQTVVSNYRKHEIPLQTVWTDLDYMIEKQDFTVNEKVYPLEKFAALLRDVRYIPLIDAGVSMKTAFAMEKGSEMNVFVKKGGAEYVAKVWPGNVHFVDFLHPNSTTYWTNMFRTLHDKVKFSGVWLDMNEVSNFQFNRNSNQTYRVQHDQPLTTMTIDMDCQHYNKDDPTKPIPHSQVHAYYGHLQVMATYNFLKSVNKRPFIITRSNSVGTGRYAGHWTGDNVATWNFLRLSVGGNFLSQIFGMQMVGADVCGFHGDTTDELCARWFQLGSLYPFARSHNEDVARDQEPYALGNMTLNSSRLSLNQRYAILKQYYSIFMKTKGVGSLFRPLFFEFPNDEKCYLQAIAEEQFLIGEFLMSTPILKQHQTEKPAYFPGLWYDISTGKHFTNTITIQNKLPSAPPLFLRSGYILFMNEPRNRLRDLPHNYKLTIGFQSDAYGNLKAQGFIMSIVNFDEESQIDHCVNDGCFYNFVVTKKREDNALTITWTYSGNQSLQQRVEINQVECFLPDGTVLVNDGPVTLLVQGTGTNSLGLKQRVESVA